MAWKFPVLSAGWWALKKIGKAYAWAFRHPLVGFTVGAAIWFVGKRRDWATVKRFGGALMGWSLIGWGVSGWGRSTGDTGLKILDHLKPPTMPDDAKWWEIWKRRPSRLGE